MEIEPFLADGAHVYFIADKHSYGIAVSAVYGTDWQQEFESDFNFVWTEKNRLQHHSFEVTVTFEIHSKWFKRASCR